MNGFEFRMADVRSGIATVLVNGVDISNSVCRIELVATPAMPPEIKLVVRPGDVEVVIEEGAIRVVSLDDDE